MHVIKTVLFTAEETRVLRRAQSLIDIAYPPASDPLVLRERAVADDDERRRVLKGLLSPFDPIARPRLVLAHRALTDLAAQVEKESSLDHWLGVASHPDNPQTRQMAEVLAAERTGQQRLVGEALEIVDTALAQVGEADDPRLLREERWA
ncbi:hypothetical protein [Nocardioides pakistanensis]